MNRHLRPSAVLAVAVMTAVVCQAQEPTLDEVVDRLGRYISDYETKIVQLAAEEEYEQRIKRRSGYGGEVVARRKLTSTFLFARLPTGQAWFGVRDVVRVDGKPVSGRGRSLEQLLQEGTLDALAEANRVVRENAKYNIGAVYRTVNLPLQAIELLRAEHRRRFEFTSVGRARMAGSRVWQIAYAERVRPSLINDGFGGDRLTNGHVWVDPTTGAVHKTEISIEKVNLITVEFRHNDRFQMLLPSSMEEVYELAIEVVNGRANYSDYRRFQTSARIVDK
ncbi:MAG TPA: hypothetical protein VFO58_21845 [Vicinamibacterales bacterium]|nr:hypothetical protein [Vicinamibacterales bacterium]